MNIPILNLKRQYLSIKEEIDTMIDNVLAEQNFILGREVKELETAIASYIRGKYAIAVASGTDALLLALKAAGVGNGDEVITTPFTFVATADTILLAGATPVFVDIDHSTFNIDPELIKKAITKKTKAIIPVHLYGLSCDMDSIMKIAREDSLIVIEDVAQAFGGRWGEKRLGSIGLAGCFSFFPSKNLGCFGDGGMVVTSDLRVAEKVEMLRKHGGRDKYNVDMLGHNSRLDTLQAAILLAKFRHIDKWNKGRRIVAELYNKELCGINGLELPAVNLQAYHVYHQYTIRTKRRDELQRHLKDKGIGSMVYYPVPLHMQKVFNGVTNIVSSLKNSENAANEVLSLPIEPLQTLDETMHVVKMIKEFLR